MDPDPVPRRRDSFRQGCERRRCCGLHKPRLSQRGKASAWIRTRPRRRGSTARAATAATRRAAPTSAISTRQGIGMVPDLAEAARLYRQGCDGGDAGGCTNLGVLHEEGIGMDPDPAEAARLYRQGCDGGDARGCTKLGYLYDEGIGMDPDPAEAAQALPAGLRRRRRGGLHQPRLSQRARASAWTRTRPRRRGSTARAATAATQRGCTNLGILQQRRASAWTRIPPRRRGSTARAARWVWSLRVHWRTNWNRTCFAPPAFRRTPAARFAPGRGSGRGRRGCPRRC